MTAASVPGPVSAVLAAFESGSGSLDDVTRRTGLGRDVVDAAVAHLVRVGRLDAKELAVGCPPSGCGACASGRDDGSAGCGAEGPGAGRRGPVLVALSVRRS